jgi:ribulose-phosphate 3-epimerase
MILIMTVDPGFGGQRFIPGMLSKIRALRRWLDREGAPAELEVDGGIKLENIADVASSGATVFVSGSGILKTPDYAATISGMREEIRKARAAGGGFHEAKGISLPGGG